MEKYIKNKRKTLGLVQVPESSIAQIEQQGKDFISLMIREPNGKKYFISIGRKEFLQNYEKL